MSRSRVEDVLARSELRLRRQLAGQVHGSRLSGLPGVGIEPRDIREYQHGDDVRRMAWAVTARTAVPHVMTLEDERDVTAWILVDDSPSMHWGTALSTKFDLAIELAAAFGVLLGQRGNRLGGGLLRDGSVRLFKPRRGRASVAALLAQIDSSAVRARRGAPARRHDLALSLATAARSLRKRSLVIVLSDFLDPEFERPLGDLAIRNEVIAARVGDPREAMLVDTGTVVFEDPETGRQLEVDTGSARTREQFRANALTRRQRSRTAVTRSGAALLDASTDRDWLPDLIDFLEAYSRRR